MTIDITVAVSEVVEQGCGVVEVGMHIVLVGLMLLFQIAQLVFERLYFDFVRHELLVGECAGQNADGETQKTKKPGHNAIPVLNVMR